MATGKRSLYIAQTLPGFEAIAAQEIKSRLPGSLSRGTRLVGDKNGMALFEHTREARDLMSIRTAEDIFLVVSVLRDLPPTAQALRQLRQAAASAPLESALGLAKQI